MGLGIHEMGTARMGKDPKTSVLNKYNQVHDCPNVYVTDGAFMTSSACHNPSLVIWHLPHEQRTMLWNNLKISIFKILMMNRREALRSLGLTAGFVIASPSLLTLLQSCTTEKENWQPTFLSVEEGIFLNKVVDIILPKTEDSPSASEVNVPEFIDKYMDQVLMEEDEQKQKRALSSLMSKIKSEYNEDLDKVTEEEYKQILDKYLLVRGEKDIQRDENPNNSDYTDHEFLGGIKYMTINAYTNSEQVGENILVYDPIPTQYYCGDLQELTGGKAYSL